MAMKSSRKTSTGGESRSVPAPKPATGIKPPSLPGKSQRVILAAIRSYEETAKTQVNQPGSFSKWLVQVYEDASPTKQRITVNKDGRSHAEQEPPWAQWWEYPHPLPASPLIDLMNNLDLPAMYFKNLAQFRKFILCVLWRSLAQDKDAEVYLSGEDPALRLRAAYEQALIDSGSVSTLYESFISSIPNARPAGILNGYAREGRLRGLDALIASDWSPDQPVPLSVYEDVRQIVNEIDAFLPACG